MCVLSWVPSQSQSLKDQGKSRTEGGDYWAGMLGRNPLKIRASLGPWTPLHPGRLCLSQSLKDQGKSRTGSLSATVESVSSQSLKDQGKSRTLDSLAFARRQSFSLRKH